MNNQRDPISLLRGQRLTAVVFVMDYWQLLFDTDCLNVITDPSVVLKGATYTPETPGFRDALCSLIRDDVEEARAVVGSELTLEFRSGARIRISLRAEDLAGKSAEAAVLDVRGDRGERITEVW